MKLKLRDAWMILNRTQGSFLWTIRSTRRECIKAHIRLLGAGDWKHRQAMGDACIKVSVYAENWRTRRSAGAASE